MTKAQKRRRLNSLVESTEQRAEQVEHPAELDYLQLRRRKLQIELERMTLDGRVKADRAELQALANERSEILEQMKPLRRAISEYEEACFRDQWD